MENQRELDYVNLDYKDYIKKYYSNNDVSRWNKYWRDGTLSEMFSSNEQVIREKWGLSWKGGTFDFIKMRKFYNEIKDDLHFEDDIKRFFAFLAGDGYFEAHKISYEDFLNASNLNHPHEKAKDERELTLNELSQIEGGQNYIRVQLPSIGWLKM
jgi:hypothetical protein